MNKFTKAIATIMLIVAAAIVAGCNKSDEPNNGGNNGNNDSDVRVTTYTPQDITATTAVCGGDAIVVQGLSLTEIGVCWSKEQNPKADQFHLSTAVWNEPFACTLTGLESETKYYVRAYALRGLMYYYGDEKSFITEVSNGDYEYVDLGLPSGILWATRNVGANSPEEYGDYFAWGETEPKSEYNWSNYKHCNGDLDQLIKYCSNSIYGYNGFTDNLITLLPEDDVATTNNCVDWCIPTKEQWEELFQSTTNIWTTLNGVCGRCFIARNGKTLFLPAVGWFWDNGISYDGSVGCYWSSSLDIVHSYRAWDFYFDNNECYMHNDRRYGGFNVRLVRRSL